MGSCHSRTNRRQEMLYTNPGIQQQIEESDSMFNWMTGDHAFGILAEINCMRWSGYASAANTISALELFRDVNKNNRQGRKPIKLRKQGSSAGEQKQFRSTRDAVCAVTLSAVLQINLAEAKTTLRRMQAMDQGLHRFLEAECGIEGQSVAAAAMEDPAEGEDPSGVGPANPSEAFCEQKTKLQIATSFTNDIRFLQRRNSSIPNFHFDKWRFAESPGACLNPRDDESLGRSSIIDCQCARCIYLQHESRVCSSKLPPNLLDLILAMILRKDRYKLLCFARSCRKLIDHVQDFYRNEWQIEWYFVQELSPNVHITELNPIPTAVLDAIKRRSLTVKLKKRKTPTSQRLGYSRSADPAPTSQAAATVTRAPTAPSTPSASEAAVTHNLCVSHYAGSQCRPIRSGAFRRARAEMVGPDPSKRGLSRGIRMWTAIYIEEGNPAARGASTSVGLGISTKESRSWLGSHEFDYAYYNGVGKRNHKHAAPYGGEFGMSAWQSGDMFKVELNLGYTGNGVNDSGYGALRFWRNGEELGEAFDNVDCSQGPFYPTFSFDTKTHTFILMDGHSLFHEMFPDDILPGQALRESGQALRPDQQVEDTSPNSNRSRSRSNRSIASRSSLYKSTEF